MLSSKIRTIIMALVASAGFALASSGVASAQRIDPNKVGSVGNRGYDTKMCEQLANDHNGNEENGVRAAAYGNVPAAEAALETAGAQQKELEDNCFVID